MQTPAPASPPVRPGALPRYVLIGALAGFLAGLFGIGGGTIIVPLLIVLAGFTQRLGAGTSAASIIPVAAVGVVSYAVDGNVDWAAAGLLAVGAVVGAPLGVRLLHRLSETVLRWTFVGFLAVVMVSLVVVVPSRDAQVDIDLLTGAALVLVGLATGLLSGLIGIGGGVIVVPAMMLLFGASDLVAKGTSLLMMIPTSISGTVANIRRRNVHVTAALGVGIAACVMTPVGAWAARAVDPQLGNILFAAYLLFVAVQMGLRARTART